LRRPFAFTEVIWFSCDRLLDHAHSHTTDCSVAVSVFRLGKTVNFNAIASAHTHWRGSRHHAPKGIGRPNDCDHPLPGMMLTSRNWTIRKTYVSCILLSERCKVSVLSDG